MLAEGRLQLIELLGLSWYEGTLGLFKAFWVVLMCSRCGVISVGGFLHAF